MVLNELQETEYEKVRPIFTIMDYNLVVTSMIECKSPAKIYVDHPTRPRMALAWKKSKVYLAGAPQEKDTIGALRRLFDETIYPGVVAADLENDFTVRYAPNDWETKIETILPGKTLIKGRRQFYTLKQLKHDWRKLLPGDFTLLPVDADLLRKTHLKNLDRLIEEMQSERDSVDDFLRYSFGICLVHGDELVGWCLSEYNCGNRCEVGIETVEGYRRQGVATLTASALIELALSRDIPRIGWHCWADNEGSIATAKKVGFEKVRDYSVYVVLERKG